MLVFAVRRRVDRRFIPIEHHRDDHVSFPGIPEHALELLPVGDIESRVVEVWTRGVVRAHGDPRVEVRTELLVRDDRLAPKTGRWAAAQKDPHPIDLEPVQPINAVANDLYGLPAHEQKSRCSVEEIMLARTFPDKMPGIVLVHPKDAAALASLGHERASVRLTEVPLTISDRVFVLARFCREETNAVHGAVGRVAEADHGQGRRAFLAELPLDEHVRKGVLDRRWFDLERHLDKIVGLDASGRLEKENGGLSTLGV